MSFLYVHKHLKIRHIFLFQKRTKKCISQLQATAITLKLRKQRPLFTTGAAFLIFLKIIAIYCLKL